MIMMLLKGLFYAIGCMLLVESRPYRYEHVGTETTAVGTETTAVGTENSAIGTENTVVGTENTAVGTGNADVGTESADVESWNTLLRKFNFHAVKQLYNAKNIYDKLVDIQPDMQPWKYLLQNTIAPPAEKEPNKKLVRSQQDTLLQRIIVSTEVNQDDDGTQSAQNVDNVLKGFQGKDGHVYVIVLSVLGVIIFLAAIAVCVLAFKPSCFSCLGKWVTSNKVNPSDTESVVPGTVSRGPSERVNSKGVVSGTLQKPSEKSLSHMFAGPVSAKITPEIKREMEKKRNCAIIANQGSDYWKNQVKTLLLQRKSEYRASQSECAAPKSGKIVGEASEQSSSFSDSPPPAPHPQAKNKEKQLIEEIKRLKEELQAAKAKEQQPVKPVKLRIKKVKRISEVSSVM